MKRKSWDSYYLEIAQRVADRSPCLSAKIGAILVKDKIVICQGYNGPARDIPHCGEERMKHDIDMKQRIDGDAINPVFGDINDCPRKRLGFSPGRGLRFCPAVHAEANCIANAARLGIRTFNTSMYLTCGVPCKDCLSLIINAGIAEVVVTSLNYYDTLTKFIDSMSSHNTYIRTYELEE